MNIAYAASACVSSNTERSSEVGGGLRCLNTPIGHVGEGLRPPCVRDKYYGKRQRR